MKQKIYTYSTCLFDEERKKVIFILPSGEIHFSFAEKHENVRIWPFFEFSSLMSIFPFKLHHFLINDFLLKMCAISWGFQNYLTRICSAHH